MKVKLKEVVADFVVPMRDRPKTFGGTIPWCRIEDLEGKYLYGTKSNKYVSPSVVKSMNLRILPVNSVLFTCSATIGAVAITKREVCTNQTFIGLVAGNKINCDYLYYYLKLCKRRFQRLASITTIPYISRNLFEEFEIDIYSIETQQEIAATLSVLDSKIELNNRINIELEALTKTLYDYWFVQFDFPNAKGKPYKSSGGKMVWNEELKRNVPIGWRVDNIEKCCSIIDCLHSKKSERKFENEKYYLLQLENIKDDGLMDLTSKYYVTKDEYNKWTTRIEVKEGDVVITNAGRVAATSQIPKGLIAGIGRNITAIRPIAISPSYLFLSFRGPDLKRQIKSNTDSGAFFSSFNVKGIKKLFIVRPPVELENWFEKIARPIQEKRELNNYENQKLSELRDWLLPMLMNAQVQVNHSAAKKSLAASLPDRKSNRVNQTQWQTLLLARYINVLKEQKPQPILQGEVGIAKYAYLADKLFQANSGFTYQQHNFGPYDPAISKRLAVRKYFKKTGDIKFKVYDLTKGGMKLIQGASVDFSKADSAMKDLTEVFSKFKKDKSRKLELMASVCWQIEKLKSTDTKKIWKGFKTWKIVGRVEKNKAEVFTEAEVKSCLKFIKEKKWNKKLI